MTWEHRDQDPQVLFVTNMWPDVKRPVYGIFVQRQIYSLRETGLRCDVLYVRGYRRFGVYVAAAMWFLLRQSAVRRRYGLVHAHGGETALVVGALGGMPKLASYCGDDVLGQAREDGTFSRQARARRWLIQQTSRLCTLTITKSREMADVLPDRVRPRNFVVPNGINAAEFRPVDPDEARRRLDWDQQERVVVFVATRPHEARKRLDLARGAVEVAEREVGPVRLFVAENVPPETLPLIMSAADCLLLTSRMEGSPNAVKEAIMCNLPVVSTDVGDVAEQLDGVSNSAVCIDSPADLGAALARILKGGDRSDGRERRKDLDQSEIAKRVLRIYARAGWEAPTG